MMFGGSTLAFVDVLSADGGAGAVSGRVGDREGGVLAGVTALLEAGVPVGVFLGVFMNLGRPRSDRNDLLEEGSSGGSGGAVPCGDSGFGCSCSLNCAGSG